MEKQTTSLGRHARMLAGLAGLVLLCPAPLTLAAQQPQPELQRQPGQDGKDQHAGKDVGECLEGAPAARPGTTTETGPDSGTKNMGSTGWSGGGLGGSHNETVPKGPALTSKTWQPPTASGLDPVKSGLNSRPRC